MKKFELKQDVANKLESLVADLIPVHSIINAYADGMLTIKEDVGGKVFSIHWFQYLILHLYAEMSVRHWQSSNKTVTADKIHQHKVVHVLINASSGIHPIETAYNEWSKVKKLLPVKEETIRVESTISHQKTQPDVTEA